MKTYPYLLLFLLVAAFAGAGVVNYEYDDAGRLTGVHYQDVSRTSYIYDPSGNVVCIGDRCDVYVEKSKTCGGKKPCYELVGKGIRAAGASANLKISSDSVFSENVVIDQDTDLAIQGGWSPDFVQKTGSTSIQGSLTVQKGTVTVEGLPLSKALRHRLVGESPCSDKQKNLCAHGKNPGHGQSSIDVHAKRLYYSDKCRKY